jgi:hypothetical protein
VVTACQVSEYLAPTVQPDVGVQEECDVDGQWATNSACTDCRGTSLVHLQETQTRNTYLPSFFLSFLQSCQQQSMWLCAGFSRKTILSIAFRIGNWHACVAEGSQVGCSRCIRFCQSHRPFLHGPSHHPSFILNMDQTPVYYSVHEKHTLAKKGDWTVSVRRTQRITVAVTISALSSKASSCFLLMLFLID